MLFDFFNGGISEDIKKQIEIRRIMDKKKILNK